MPVKHKNQIYYPSPGGKIGLVMANHQNIAIINFLLDHDIYGIYMVAYSFQLTESNCLYSKQVPLKSAFNPLEGIITPNWDKEM